MSSLGCIIGRDKWDLSDCMSVAVTFLIEHDEELSRIAERFDCSNRVEAFSDIMKKGLQEYLDMCDMDDRLSQQDEALMDSAPSMPNVPTGKGGSI